MLTTLTSLFAGLVAPTLASAAAALATLAIHQLVQLIKAKTHNEKAGGVLDRLDSFAGKAVAATEQTVVDTLKASGNWGDAGSWKTASDAALASLKQLAAAELPTLAAQGVTDIDGYLRTLLEAKLKQGEPVTLPAFTMSEATARALGYKAPFDPSQIPAKG